MRLLVILICLLSLAACAPRQAAEPTGDLAKARFHEQLQAALLDDPDLVLDLLREHDIEAYEIVSKGAEHKRQRAEEKRLSDELVHPLKPVVQPDRPIRGKADAPVTVVSYTDFLCSWCARGTKTTDELLKKHPDDVRLVYKFTPHSEISTRAALYFEALTEQDEAMAFALHDRIFVDQSALAEGGEDWLRAQAVELGADMQRLDADLEREDLKGRLAADEKEADSFGFQGTPMYVVGGVSVRGAQPLEQFEQIVRLVLEREGAR